ncbi:glutaredoxin family protein [Gryllotalpicola reticulitermitis]|uniref:Glutaredoxin family protein n=1 Tax=Gryllotalpicola reticulitermitis TaxID=1184153 RepID=A0ABV8Q7E0_9MICO
MSDQSSQPEHRITFYSKPGCHLCEDARAVVDDVVARVEESVAGGIAIDEVDILGDPALQQRYGEEIPVVLIDGKMHTYWRVDAARLENALKELA